MTKWPGRVVLLLLGSICLAILPFLWLSGARAGAIQCQGGTAPTRAMPVAGTNFGSYCMPCIAALRTFAREPVIETITATYKALAVSHPQTRHLYGEIGFPNGGKFRPHRTHREGLSVDLMVPLTDGRVIATSVTNRFGYDAEFDFTGKGKDGQIDFDVLASLIVTADQQARKRGGKVRRVFFAPDLQPLLFASDPVGLRSVTFNKHQSWVRHDDHIHIDFEFPCPAS